MRITTITYRRVWNRGNYESETIEATADLDANEDSAGAMDRLRAWVNQQAQATPQQATQRPAAPTPTERAPMPAAGDAMATPAQVNAIYAIGRREFHWTDEDTDAHCRSVFGRPAGELTKREASELIDRMKTNLSSV